MVSDNMFADLSCFWWFDLLLGLKMSVFVSSLVRGWILHGWVVDTRKFVVLLLVYTWYVSAVGAFCEKMQTRITLTCCQVCKSMSFMFIRPLLGHGVMMCFALISFIIFWFLFGINFHSCSRSILWLSGYHFYWARRAGVTARLNGEYLPAKQETNGL